MTHEDGVGRTHRQQSASPSTPHRHSRTLHGLLGASHAIDPVHACRPLGSFRASEAWRVYRAAALPHRSFQQSPCYADVFGQHLLLALQCLDAPSLLCWRQGQSHPASSRTRPRRSPGDMLNPPGPWRRLSSSLDVMAHSPLTLRIVKSRRNWVYIFLFSHLTGGILIR